MNIHEKVHVLVNQTFYQTITDSNDYYYSTVKDLYEQYKSFDISNIIPQLEDFVNNPPQKFDSQEFLTSTQEDIVFNNFIDLIFKTICGFDTTGWQGIKKEYATLFKDNRSISNATFTQKNWVYCLFKYKLNRFTFAGLESKRYNTFRTTINYINNPEKDISVTSANHRKKILEYFNLSGEDELITLFPEFTTSVKNPLNKGVLIANLLYNDEVKQFWLNGTDTSHETNSNTDIMNDSKNIILFGPPGTGKTYNTINYALKICGVDISGLKRDEIKRLFNQKVQEHQIIFTTFHQSMAYEDFVEGIKPCEPAKEGDPIIYKVEEGIFRIICINASFSLAKENENKEIENVLDFSLAYANFVQELEEALSTEKIVHLETKNGGKILVDSISSNGNIIVKHRGGIRTYTVSKSRISKLHKEIHNLEDVNNINDQFRAIIGGSNSSAYWSVLNAIRKKNINGIAPNKKDRSYTLDEKREVVQSMGIEDYTEKKGLPFVLIIDEINRGNVSQIFGELITLIESDKRLGNKEAIKLQLPYSKELFGVPSNLYILGTLNTADRSVETLDTALRRRFSFEEMLPRYDLPELQYEYSGYQVHNILETINLRIEKLLDKDHMIGHSYFIKQSDTDIEAHLLNIFYKNIIPLLQEYFFGDYGKIGLVLGEGFVRLNEWPNQSFARFRHQSEHIFDDKEVYSIIDYRNTNQKYTLSSEEGNIQLSFEKAIILLMNGTFE